MNKPFIFGTAADQEHFIGREKEQQRLIANLTHGINTILMSPRRWGKTSLVKNVCKEMASPDILVVFVDIFSCRDEYDFCNKFAYAVLRQSGNKLDEWKDLVADFVSRLTPKISLTASPDSDYSVSLGITPRTHKPEEVYDLPQRIADKKRCHIVICIDEFQQVGEFPNALSVQKRMRTAWQHQPDVTYCLFGSKRHMMEDLFLHASYPFYKFGDIVPIAPIPTELWTPYIQRGFASEGKHISDTLCAQLCDRVRNHSSYVQQLAWLTLLNTHEEATEEALQAAVQDLIDENSQLFVQQTEGLSSYQLNFLRALLDGIEDDFGKASVREEYNLGSYSNIARIKAALTNKELITTDRRHVTISDPVLALWLRQTLQ